jgi:IclR family transcriptional regulator, acetate operon repressor
VEQEFQPADGSPPAAQTGTQTIDRAANLLVGVLEGDRPRAVGDLAAQAGLPKSTASRLLAALERNGLVEQEGNRGGFRAGPVVVRFAHRGLVGANLVELAQEPLAKLGELTGETINLAVAGPGGVEHLAQVESRHFLGTGQWIGRRVPYERTANGKVLLAFGAAEAPDGLAEELARVRADGFATAVDELEEGLTAIAVPVFGETGDAAAAISVSGPTLRLTPERIEEIRPAITEQGLALSRRLGHREEGTAA